MKKTTSLLLILVLLSMVSYIWIFGLTDTPDSSIDSFSLDENPVSETVPVSTSSPYLKMHVIDVGQGDSILLEYNDTTILVDGGSRTSYPSLINYLENEGVTTIDYLIATHPHADHIGGFTYLMNAFDIEMYVDNQATHSSKTYANTMTSVRIKDIAYDTVVRGDSFVLSPNVSVSVLSPSLPLTEDLNEDSIVLKATYDEIDFLLMGDAGHETESTLLVYESLGTNSSMAIEDIEVLKVGHHGSYSATSNEFIEYIGPEIAILSLGADNSYGHPHQVVIDTLNGFGLDIYRTDQDGTITVLTDGQSYRVENENP